MKKEGKKNDGKGELIEHLPCFMHLLGALIIFSLNPPSRHQQGCVSALPGTTQGARGSLTAREVGSLSSLTALQTSGTHILFI